LIGERVSEFIFLSSLNAASVVLAASCRMKGCSVGEGRSTSGVDEDEACSRSKQLSELSGAYLVPHKANALVHHHY